MSPTTVALWNDVPQNHSMVGIVNGAARLSARWDDAV